MKHQIPNTNNQIMTNIQKNSKSFGDWSLMIGYYLVIGIW
jgi:hypothetical protein